MSAIHVRISHNNNLVIAEFGDVEIITIPFRKSTAKGIDHRLDLRIGKYLIDTCFFHVQNLSADWQNCLIRAVSRRLCGTSRRISLHDKNLAFVCISALTVCKLSIAVKRIFLLRQQICLCLLLRLTDFCGLLSTADYFFKRIQIPVKIAHDLLSGHLSGRL